jgi:hypothetical protein
LDEHRKKHGAHDQSRKIAEFSGQPAWKNARPFEDVIIQKKESESPKKDWIAQYARSVCHPVHRLCATCISNGRTNDTKSSAATSAIDIEIALRPLRSKR